ncbi:MAG: ATP-grasp fold amidoligase family protein [Devosia sp.]
MLRELPQRWTDAVVLALANGLAVLSHPGLAFRYVQKMRGWPLFATPRGHSAMVQWRKIFDRNPQFVLFCDKYRTKQWARERDPEIALAEVVWTGTRPEDIPDEFLAPGYLLKANHGSGYNYFPHRKRWPRERVERRFRHWLSRRFRGASEWAYWHVEPMLHIERMLPLPLWEITFRCHDGVVSAFYVAIDQKLASEHGNYFAASGERLPLAADDTESEDLPADFMLPPVFATARRHAELLSQGVDYVRVDLMCVGDAVYFCEMTVYVGSGFGRENNSPAGALIEKGWLGAIGVSWFLSTPQPWPLSLYARAFQRWVQRRRQELGQPAQAD